MGISQTLPIGGEAIARNELARASDLWKRNQRPQALNHYKAAVQIAAGNHGLLALVARELERQCKRFPREPVFRHLLGALWFFTREFRQAEVHLRQAAKLAPRDIPILSMLGDTLVHRGETDEALAVFRRAVAASPANHEARLRLAGLLAYRGEKLEARDLYRQLVADGAQDPLAYAGLIEVSDYAGTTDDPIEYSAAISLAENHNLPAALRRMLHFSAAKVDRARGRLDREFAHYVQGKAHFPRRFDLSYFSDVVGALKDAITPQFYAERATFGDPSTLPIVIFGMPRSGTTLTEQILGAHRDVAAGGELTFFQGAVAQLGLTPQPSTQSVPPERLAARLASLDISEAKRIASQYLGELRSHGVGQIRVTDKMPQNFLHLWLIALLFPDATYIHCVRDPMATCFSCFTTDLTDAHAYTRDLATLGAYYNLYADLMRHWRQVLPISMMENRYEDLVSDPEPSVRRLVEAARLPWDPDCLLFHQSTRVARTASYAAVRQPINSGRLDAWKAYASHLEALKVALSEPVATRRRAIG